MGEEVGSRITLFASSLHLDPVSKYSGLWKWFTWVPESCSRRTVTTFLAIFFANEIFHRLNHQGFYYRVHNNRHLLPVSLIPHFSITFRAGQLEYLLPMARLGFPDYSFASGFATRNCACIFSFSPRMWHGLPTLPSILNRSFVHSFRSLSYDKFMASSKSSSPHSAF